MNILPQKIFEIPRLIFREITGTISEEEQHKLKQWRNRHPDNEDTYRQLRDSGKLLEEIRQLESIDVVRPLADMQLRILSAQMKKRKLRRLWILSAAAVVLLCLGSLYLLRQEVPRQTIIPEQPILAGTVRAILHLENGAIVDLDTLKQNVRQGGVELVKTENGKLTYASQTDALKVESRLIYNRIEVPRGGEYMIILADGSKVWLNSETELKYPVAFSAEKREVYLTGEAYFEVVKDLRRPFIVHTPQTMTTVLGTSFNVMAYQGEEHTQITLVTGAVSVNAGSKKCRIAPGYQVAVDNESLNMSQQPVNVDFYVSWKEGLFDFEGMTLEELATKLGRWYDVDFFFASREAAGKRFTGAIERNNTLQFMLDFIQKATNVHFEVKGKAVTVYNR